MKKIGKLFRSFAEYYNKTAFAGVTAVYASSVLLIITGAAQHYSGYESGAYFLAAGIIELVSAAAVQLIVRLSMFVPGPKSSFVSDYDRTVIGNAFVMGHKRIAFYTALSKMREDEFDDALAILRDFDKDSLSDNEKGVLSFYTSVCYSKMGYPTNAANFAAEAVEHQLRLPETLLMAARNYSLAGNKASAEEYYTRLIAIAEEEKIFPFVFNEAGRLYLTDNKANEAETLFRKSMEYGLDPATAQSGMALVKLIQGCTEEAAEWYRLALISRIPDIQSYKEVCAQVCIANGYPENYLESCLADKYAKERQTAAE